MPEHSPVLLSLDIDWAPEHILEDTFELISQAKQTFAVFCTHNSPMIQKIIALPNVEVGIHPNFKTGEEESVLSSILSIFPQATLVRNHALYFHYALYKLFWQKKLRVFSNDLWFLKKEIAPFYDWTGMLRLPIVWEDDVHSVYFGGDFSHKLIDWNVAGLKIVSFHPIHLYLNTQAFQTYMTNKETLKDPQKAPNVRLKGQGTRSFFEKTIQSSSPFSSFTEVTKQFIKNHSYTGQFETFMHEQERSS